MTQPKPFDIAATISEEAAAKLVDLIVSRFGWQHAIWDRSDVCNAAAEFANTDDDTLALTDAEWGLVRATRAWRNIADDAYAYISEGEIIQDAIRASGVFCVDRDCTTRLGAHPSQTGYVCDRHRVGNNGERAVVSPDSGDLFWLDAHGALWMRRFVKRLREGDYDAGRPGHEKGHPVTGRNLDHPHAMAALAALSAHAQ